MRKLRWTVFGSALIAMLVVVACGSAEEEAGAAPEAAAPAQAATGGGATEPQQPAAPAPAAAAAQAAVAPMALEDKRPALGKRGLRPGRYPQRARAGLSLAEIYVGFHKEVLRRSTTYSGLTSSLLG